MATMIEKAEGRMYFTLTTEGKQLEVSVMGDADWCQVNVYNTTSASQSYLIGGPQYCKGRHFYRATVEQAFADAVAAYKSRNIRASLLALMAHLDIPAAQ